ncbi:MAG: thioredoxin domain-containing protein [Candidatus Komeilibacteria bacterium]|nr:thioredoxin domain-containing protein [Candidatus Komeilibacteria bacterium]
MDQLPNINHQEIILPKSTKHWYRRWWGILLLIFAAYFLLTFILLLFNKSSSPSSATLKSGAVKVDEQKLYLNAGINPTAGSQGAKVTIVEFADFQCSYCRQEFSIVRELLQTYGDRIYFIFRDFPISELHPEAFKAAVAGRCAQEQNKFWALHDQMFINQANLKIADLENYAAGAGLNAAQFNQCLNSNKYDQQINQDYADGFDLGVKGTPTFFIQGYRVAGVIPKDKFVKIIDAALAE